MKKYIFLLMALLTFGCETSPTRWTTSYYENVYLEEIDYSPGDSVSKVRDYLDITFMQQPASACILGDCLPNVMNFYQDKYKHCFLFSYTDKQLFGIMSASKLFVVDKDKVISISNRDLDKLKDKALPHSYDPSLCKQKPDLQ